jgi:hypothetical protein
MLNWKEFTTALAIGAVLGIAGTFWVFQGVSDHGI